MTKESMSLFELRPGKEILGRFMIVEPTRQNDLAFSFAATEDGAPCELTVFPPALFDDPRQVDEFVEFWQSWATVESPHVVRLREVIAVEDACVLLVTDDASGTSLRRWMKDNGRMETARALLLGVQLAEGLTEIHGAGLVHGDIKPQTILVSEDGDEIGAKLVGGGVTTGLWNAKGLGERTALIGTPYYAPVEQFGGESPDEQSDIYNVATVLFELVAGVLPWPGTSFLEVFQAKLDKSAPSIRMRAPDVDVDAAVEQAIVRGLLADKQERFASAADQLAALRAVL